MALTSKQVNDHAKEALEFLYMTNDDSFAPTNAVRCLADYDDLSSEDRIAINKRLEELA